MHGGSDRTGGGQDAEESRSTADRMAPVGRAQRGTDREKRGDRKQCRVSRLLAIAPLLSIRVPARGPAPTGARLRASPRLRASVLDPCLPQPPRSLRRVGPVPPAASAISPQRVRTASAAPREAGRTPGGCWRGEGSCVSEAAGRAPAVSSARSPHRCRRSAPAMYDYCHWRSHDGRSASRRGRGRPRIPLAANRAMPASHRQPRRHAHGISAGCDRQSAPRSTAHDFPAVLNALRSAEAGARCATTPIDATAGDRTRGER